MRSTLRTNVRKTTSNQVFVINWVLNLNVIYNVADSSQFCAFEEYVNSSLAHNDVLYERKTKQECEDLCERTTSFNCRGYSTLKLNNRFNCYLHSEDTKIHGPKLLTSNSQSTYYEKARCINSEAISSPINILIN